MTRPSKNTNREFSRTEASLALAAVALGTEILEPLAQGSMNDFRGAIPQRMIASAGRGGRGFSVIEALISLVLLLIAVLGILAAIPMSFGNTVRDSERVQAIAAGQQYLDQIDQYVMYNGFDTGLPTAPPIPVDAGNTFEGNGTTATSPGTFAMTPSCSQVPSSNNEFDCSVTVAWTENNANRSVVLESYVTSQH